LVNFKSTNAELESSVILFLYLFFVKFNSENRDSHAHVDENIDKIAFANIFKQLNVSGIAFHVIRISSSAILFILLNNRLLSIISKSFLKSTNFWFHMELD
jgi:hypothetical protein